MEERITYPYKKEEEIKHPSRVSIRQSNIELLRILCMIMIVAHHFSVHTKLAYDPSSISFNRLYYEFLYTWGKIGVNIFVIITGYFSFRNVTLKMGKVFQFYLQTFFYSVAIFAIFAIFNLPVGDSGNFVFTWSGFFQNLFPITHDRWWFASAYFVLIILSPFINLFISNINRSGLKLVLLILGIFYVVIPTFFIYDNFFTAHWGTNQIVWFVFMYLLGAYYGKYGFRFDIKASRLFLLALAIMAVTFITVIIFDKVGMKDPWYLFENKNKYYYEMQSIPILIASVCIFQAFLKIDIGSNKIINAISSVTFGIYLIHDNLLLRELWWKNIIRDTVLTKWLNFPNVESIQHFIPLSIAIILFVFIVGGIIEAIRLYLIEPLYIKGFLKLGKKIDDNVDEYIKKEGFNS